MMELDFEISERKLEDIVYNRLRIDPEGIFDGQYYECVQRQVNIGNAGIIDIIGITEAAPGGPRRIDIFELKKNKINLQTLSQAKRYQNAIEKIITELECSVKIGQIYLIGGEIDRSSGIQYFLNEVDNLSVFTYWIDEDGIDFEDQRIDEYDGSTTGSFRYIMSEADYGSHDFSCGYYNYLKLKNDEAEISRLLINMR